MTGIIGWKRYLSESINAGLIVVLAAASIMIVTGFTAAFYSSGESMLMAARTFTYPVAPYFLFSLIGFAVFNSSRRRPLLTVAFNVGAVLMLIETISIISINMSMFDDIEAMASQIFMQNFFWSIVVVIIFSIISFANLANLTAVEKHSEL